jgi:putative ABC transport system permease protein
VSSLRSLRISLARAIFAGSLAQNKARTILSVLSIALGVALGYAVQLISGAAVNELGLGVQFLSGSADLQVRGPGDGFDESIYPDLARLPEVLVASPVVEVDAKLANRSDVLKIIGIDAFRAAAIQPGLVADAADRSDLLRSDTLFLSPAAARWLDVDTGATLTLQNGLRAVPLRVAGTVVATAEQRIAVMDIAGAQQSFDRLGHITRVDLRVRPGVDVAALRERLRERLPAGTTVERPEASIVASASLSRSYRINLNVLALVALFTGGMLVFSTQALAVVRRRAQFALLRVLGVTRRQLVTTLVTEGILIGVAGGCIGLVGGFALANLALLTVGADFGAGYFRGRTPALSLEPIALATFLLLGIAVAALGSAAPAFEAARSAPAMALKAGDEERALTRLRSPWLAVATLAVGVGATLPPVGGLPLFGYGAIALLLVGTLMLMPRIAAALLAACPVPKGPAPRLAVLQLRGRPGQAALSLAAIVASVSLTVSMAIMVASFRTSLDTWLQRVLPADIYIRANAAGNTAYMTPADQANVAAIAGIRRIEFVRELPLLLDAKRPRVTLLARGSSAERIAAALQFESDAVMPPPDAPPPVWINEAMVDVYAMRVGNVVTLPLAGTSTRFTVAGIWRDYARPQGALIIERERYVALTGDRNATNAAMWLAPGVSADAVVSAIEDVPGGSQLDIAAPGEIRALSLRAFDRTFAVTYALELAAVIIGLFGLSSSFGALVLARRREFGLLRHLGMTRRQIAGMLAAEGTTISAIGLIAGGALGWVISLILIRVVNRQSFHWNMELFAPWSLLAAAAALMLALSATTAMVVGRQAMGERAILAVKDDW